MVGITSSVRRLPAGHVHIRALSRRSHGAPGRCRHHPGTDGLDVSGAAVLLRTGWSRHWRTEEYGATAHSLLLASGVPAVEHLTALERLPETGARFTAVPPGVRGMGTFAVRASAHLPWSATVTSLAKDIALRPLRSSVRAEGAQLEGEGGVVPHQG
jgi:hypothetical protein